jgi:exopolyphosphatase / guanosine-5'-triphosphate,3'-diphosphate pyrophosphatase
VRVAVLDLGTNSTRLLVADVRDGTIEELERRTVITRLGQGVDETGRLAEEAMERVYDAVAEYRKIIDELGAEKVFAVATSAVRDASNGDEFRDTLKSRFGVEAAVIPGEEEARLTFLGATSARPDDDPTLVLDIGGGSTEFVVGRPREDPEFHKSLQIGSVRQTERHIRQDPPSPDEVTELAEEVVQIINSQIPAKTREDVQRGIAVAGTATSVAAIAQELDPYDPKKVHGFKLSLGEAERILAMLAALPLEKREQIKGLNPARAPTIVAGTVILVEAMREFELDEMETSEADILHGVAIFGTSVVPESG